MKVLVSFLAVFFLLSCSTSTPTVEPVTTPTVVKESDVAKVSDILSIMEKSSCAKTSFSNGQGRAKMGFIKGVGLTYARAYCRGIYFKPGSADRDALVHYGVAKADDDANLITTYALAFDFGMQESSGRYWLGRDGGVHISQQTAATTEAGLFQTSYNSLGGFDAASGGHLGALYSWYKDNPEHCHKSVFGEGFESYSKKEETIGSGAGAEYQKFNKACPSFAVEYALTMARVGRKHYGPLNRKQAKIQPNCVATVTELYGYLVGKSCEELL